MAETTDRQLTAAPASAAGTAPSISEVRAQIRQTRTHLAAALQQTTERIEVLLSDGHVRVPTESGVLAVAVKSVQRYHRAKAAWTRARAAGIVGKSGVAVAVAGIAAFVVVRARSRRRPGGDTSPGEEPA